VARGARRERGSGRFDRSCDFLQHRACLFQYVVIPKAQDAVTFTNKPGIAFLISRVLRMLTAIELDNQFVIEADEVNDVRPNRRLPLELEIMKSMRTQSVP
jgi:hypothetical protein